MIPGERSKDPGKTNVEGRKGNTGMSMGHVTATGAQFAQTLETFIMKSELERQEMVGALLMSSLPLPNPQQSRVASRAVNSLALPVLWMPAW